MLSQASSRFRVAVARDDDDLLFGFVAGAMLEFGNVLDYIFVKPVYRRMGIGHELLRAFGQVDAYTHHTELSRYVVGRAVFDPYRFFFRA